MHFSFLVYLMTLFWLCNTEWFVSYIVHVSVHWA